MQLLRVYGYHVGAPGQAVNREDLPVVMALPATRSHEVLPEVTQTFPMTETDPLHELMVFYAPEQVQAVSRLMSLLEESIDVPARQIMIEAMILEINEMALDRLGVEWSLSASPEDNLRTLRMGDVTPDPIQTPDQLVVGFTNLFGEFEANLRALVQDEQAEILSRPSVLTLDNRMAYINVSEVIPIASSRFHGNQSVQTVDFQEKNVGIQLAVRPRISANGQEVSMQVNATVSGKVPNEDVIVRDQEGNVIASSPTIAVREVRTYARIANHTPFIIGGLIAKDDLQQADGVPVLSKIPLLGRLFRSGETVRQKREVIIVITPSVLRDPDREVAGAERKSTIGRNLPKGEDRFDSFGNELFRDTYRIRESDTFDLEFVTESLSMRYYRRLAEAAVERDFRRRDQFPYWHFIDGRIPGERALLSRQVYEVLGRTELAQRVDPGRMIFFGGSAEISGDFNLSILRDYLIATAREHGYVPEDNQINEGVWSALEGQALVLSFVDYSLAGDEQQAFTPKADIQLVSCSSVERYRDLQWELNQPTEDGLPRNTVILWRPSDLERLKHAILLRETIRLNRTSDELTLADFSVGRMLILPTRNDQEFDLIDREIAELDFFVDRYYDILKYELARCVDALEKAELRN